MAKTRTRRTFTDDQKREHVSGYEQSADKGAYLKSHILSSSLISYWRRQFPSASPGMAGSEAGKARISKHYTAEEKQQHVLAAAAHPGGALGYAKEVGLRPATLYGWRKLEQVAARGRPSTTRNGAPPSEELEALREQNTVLKALLQAATSSGFSMEHLMRHLIGQ